MLQIHYDTILKWFLSPNLILATFTRVKVHLHPNKHLQCGVEGWVGGKILLLSVFAHTDVHLSAQPLLTFNDGLLEWPAQPLRDQRRKKREDEN